MPARRARGKWPARAAAHFTAERSMRRGLLLVLLRLLALAEEVRSVLQDVGPEVLLQDRELILGADLVALDAFPGAVGLRPLVVHVAELTQLLERGRELPAVLRGGEVHET